MNKNYANPHEKPFKPRKFLKKKSLGQHFLRNKSVVETMVEKVIQSCKDATVLEIGCGDGFLTEQILSKSGCSKLICLEIDQHWASVVKEKFEHDPRLEMINADALRVDWASLNNLGKPMVLLANLPYNVASPILRKLCQYSNIFAEGVVMVQEEVAQRTIATEGRNLGFISLFLQHSFNLSLMTKIGPESFSPPPKVDSRLIYFRPKPTKITIDREESFWKFIKASFASPRRMLKNNLKGFNFDQKTIDEKAGLLRAQQMKMDQFIDLWQNISQSSSAAE